MDMWMVPICAWTVVLHDIPRIAEVLLRPYLHFNIVARLYMRQMQPMLHERCHWVTRCSFEQSF